MKTRICLLSIGIMCFFGLAGCKYFSTPEVTLGKIVVPSEPSNVYYAGYWPDGKICAVKKGDIWQLFWGEAESVKTEGASVWPESQYGLVKKTNVVFGKGKSSIANFNENGSWFIGVHPLNEEGRYVGFFHAESHWVSPAGIAHKSIGVTYSDDYGQTWEVGAPIIVDENPKPAEAEWSGLGDGTVIWDFANERWICYYQGKRRLGGNVICMAASYDKEGKPGTWKKWDGKDFTLDACGENGLGGKNHGIKELEVVAGANPSVIWSEYLKKWVMVYASWGKEIYLTVSEDGTSWSAPKKILGSKKNPVWYPNLICEDGEKTCGKKMRMYFSYKQDPVSGKRKLAYCELELN